MYMSDPVGRGLAASLARPGGNVTGLDIDVTPDLVAKRAQLLKEAVPGLTRLAVLSGAVGTARVQQAQALVKPLGITLVPARCRGQREARGRASHDDARSS
jgi:putative ABC transport system substrate-binding protein